MKVKELLALLQDLDEDETIRIIIEDEDGNMLMEISDAGWDSGSDGYVLR